MNKYLTIKLEIETQYEYSEVEMPIREVKIFDTKEEAISYVQKQFLDELSNLGPQFRNRTLEQVFAYLEDEECEHEEIMITEYDEFMITRHDMHKQSVYYLSCNYACNQINNLVYYVVEIK